MVSVGGTARTPGPPSCLKQVALPVQEIAAQPVASGEVDETQAVEVVQNVVATIDLAQADVPAPALETAPASSIAEKSSRQGLRASPELVFLVVQTAMLHKYYEIRFNQWHSPD